MFLFISSLYLGKVLMALSPKSCTTTGPGIIFLHMNRISVSLQELFFCSHSPFFIWSITTVLQHFPGNGRWTWCPAASMIKASYSGRNKENTRLPPLPTTSFVSPSTKWTFSSSLFRNKFNFFWSPSWQPQRMDGRDWLLPLEASYLGKT